MKRKCEGKCGKSYYPNFFPKDGKLCKKCVSNKGKEANLMRTFGLTLKDFNEILKQQGSVCGICGKPPKVGGKRFAVDHDHKTGRIRGLLCYYCNYILGVWRDDQRRFANAAAYLANPPCSRYVEDLGRANGKGLMKNSTGPLALQQAALSAPGRSVGKRSTRSVKQGVSLEDLDE